MTGRAPAGWVLVDEGAQEGLLLHKAPIFTPTVSGLLSGNGCVFVSDVPDRMVLHRLVAVCLAATARVALRNWEEAGRAIRNVIGHLIRFLFGNTVPGMEVGLLKIVKTTLNAL